MPEKLNNCVLASFGKFYQNLRQVCLSFASSNDKQFFPKKFWLESVAGEIPECILALIDRKF